MNFSSAVLVCGTTDFGVDDVSRLICFVHHEGTKDTKGSNG